MVTTDIEFTTKIVPPRRSDTIVHRKHLLEELHRGLPLRVQIVTAPAGYGKTTLLVDFANDLEAPVSWYTIDQSDEDPRIFVEGIIAAIRRHFPFFGQLTEARLNAAVEAGLDTRRLAGVLTGEMYSVVPEYFVLVLDDFQVLDEKGATSAFVDHLLERMPDNCHIVIASRAQVELPSLAKLAVQGQITTVHTDQLAFTAAETKELLASNFHRAITIEKAEQLSQETKGWVLGILTLASAAAIQAGKPAGYIDSSTISRFFRHVYDQQPGEIQNFLLSTSILDDLEPAVCEQLPGMEKARMLLKQAMKRNLFIESIDTGLESYRYHHLFRDYLRRRFREENPRLYLHTHRIAALVLEKMERWHEAIDHCLSAREYAQAVRLLKEVGGETAKQGKWKTLSQWVEALPPGDRQEDPAVFLLYAQSLIHLGDNDKAIPMLNAIIARVAEEADPVTVAKAYSWRSAAYRLTGHFTEARRDAEYAIGLLERHKGSPELLGETLNRLGNIYAESGRFRPALQYFRRALRCFTAVYNLNQLAATNNSLGIIHKRLGELDKASAYFEKARGACQKADDTGGLASVLNNIGIIYQRQGQYDLALETFRLGIEKARQVGYKRMEACLLVNIAEILRDLDQWADAVATYREGLEMAREVMEPYYVVWAKAGLAETYRLCNEPDKAEVFCREAIAEATQNKQSYETALFTVQMGLIESDRKHYAQAMTVLTGAYQALQAIGDKDALAKTSFHLARIAFLNQEYQQSLRWIEESLSFADKLGYHEFLTIEGRRDIPFIEYAFSQLKVERLGSVLTELIKRQREPGKKPSSSSPVPGSTQTAVYIKAHAFGQAEVFVDTRLVDDTSWRSNRAKEMFFLLLCNKQGLTREEMAVALWPEFSPAKTSSNLHINLYRLRRALHPGIVNLERGFYRVNPDARIWFDVEEFEEKTRQVNQTQPEKVRQKLEEAVSLYRGPFLREFRGEWVEARRHTLENRYLRALSILADTHLREGNYLSAIDVLEKLLGIDPYAEKEYCRLMDAYLKTGDKIAAARLHQRYMSTVVNEANLTPSTRMIQLSLQVNKEPLTIKPSLN